MENQENENQENEIEEVLTKPKRQITDAQRQHLANIRVKAQEKKSQLKEITLKAKLAKTIQKKDLSEEYDRYIEDQKELYLLRQQSQKLQIQPEPEPEQKPIKQKKIKKVIIESSDSEEEIVYVKAKKQPQLQQQQQQQPIIQRQESFDELTYKSAQERLHLRAVDERIKHSVVNYQNLMMPQQY
jgi:hypothetical protein